VTGETRVCHFISHHRLLISSHQLGKIILVVVFALRYALCMDLRDG